MIEIGTKIGVKYVSYVAMRQKEHTTPGEVIHVSRDGTKFKVRLEGRLPPGWHNRYVVLRKDQHGITWE